ncbi:MAG: hypothetical protein NT016_00885 [Candidatus Aenigmarchaeota archaeon]|nr:hypothetical protein [Candidatus Aenigmarchaeota archaeon]
MDDSETFDSKYVFFTNQERALEYFKDNSIALDSVLHGAIYGSWYERVPACYRFDRKETYVFAFNLSMEARAFRLLDRITFGKMDAFGRRVDSYTATHFAKVFSHEQIHDILDRFVGDEHSIFRYPNTEEVFVLDELACELEDFGKHDGPFVEPVSYDGSANEDIEDPED